VKIDKIDYKEFCWKYSPVCLIDMGTQFSSAVFCTEKSFLAFLILEYITG